MMSALPAAWGASVARRRGLRFAEISVPETEQSDASLAIGNLLRFFDRSHIVAIKLNSRLQVRFSACNMVCGC